MVPKEKKKKKLQNKLKVPHVKRSAASDFSFDLSLWENTTGKKQVT